MSKLDFANIMAYIAVAVGKRLAEPSVDVYFDLLGDLPAETLQIAAKRVVLEHQYATFPSVAELRQAAVQTQQGKVVELPAADAWAMAWRAAGKIDLEIDGSVQRALAGLPEAVVKAMEAFGLPALVYGKEPVGVVRSQFTKIYEQLVARDQRLALLPPSVRKSIEAVGQKQELDGAVQNVLPMIGKKVEEA